VTSNEAATADDKVTSVLSPGQFGTELVNVVQPMVGSLVQIVAVQRPDLNSLLPSESAGVLRPAIRIKVKTEG
jgi:hypothetical protein